MKVLMIGQLPVEAGGTYTNGVCNVVYELSKCAKEEAKLIVYATNMNDNKSFKTTWCQYKGTRIRPARIVAHIFCHPLRVYRAWRFSIKRCKMSPFRMECYRDNIERLIKENAPDVIHCMNVVQMQATHYANMKFGVPIILTLHGCDPSTNSLDAAVIHLPNIVTGLTPQTIEDISALHVPQEKMVMVPNGTDTNKFYYSESDRVELREKLGVDNKTTVMLTIGSLSHRKGQYSFLTQLKEFPENFKYLYLIVGSGEDNEKIHTYIEENGLRDKVKVIGYVPNNELYRYHSAADVYVHCSRSEGQALSEVEAYATDLKIALNHDIVGTVITDTSNEEDYLIFNLENICVAKFTDWAKSHKKERKTRRQYDWREIYMAYSKVYNRL